MECPLCFDIYTEQLKRPRNMECGHTFCEQCLQRLYSSGMNQCPTCRRPSLSIPRSLPINYVVADLARKYHEDKKNCIPCEAHNKEICRFFCNTCESSICLECITNHCGHQFVKLEESIIYSKLRALEVDAVILKVLENNDSVKKNIREISNKLKLTLESELGKIDLEFEEIFKILNERKEQLKENYKNLVFFELQQALMEQEKKVDEVDCVLLAEKSSVLESLSALNSMQDGNGRIKSILNDIRIVKENVESFYKENTLGVQPPVLVPSFEMPEAEKKYVGGVGKISFAKTENIYEPAICFFGDKNKVMAYKIQENSWEMRQIDSRYEFNYYAASTTLPNGSVLITGGGSSNAVFLYSDKRVIPACPMNQIRKEHAAVLISNYVYAIGGYDGIKNDFLNECEKYCILSNKWLNCASMQVARCAFSATSVNNKFIFIFGGYDGNQRLANIEKYNPETDVWCLINATLKYQLSNCACFSPAENKVIVLGGGFSSGFSHSVDMLDIETLAWTKLSHMNEGRDLRNKITYFQGGVYCVGGYNFRAEVFNLVSNIWTQLPSYLVSDNLDSWSSALTYKIN